MARKAKSNREKEMVQEVKIARSIAASERKRANAISDKVSTLYKLVLAYRERCYDYQVIIKDLHESRGQLTLECAMLKHELEKIRQKTGAKTTRKLFVCH